MPRAWRKICPSGPGRSMARTKRLAGDDASVRRGRSRRRPHPRHAGQCRAFEAPDAVLSQARVQHGGGIFRRYGQETARHESAHLERRTLLPVSPRRVHHAGRHEAAHPDSEEMLLNAEKFASLALLYGRPYPQEEMERAWKRLLFDHFHDIMPGSGIAVNYLDAKRNLEDVQRAGREVIDGSLAEIAARIATRGQKGAVVGFQFSLLAAHRGDRSRSANAGFRPTSQVVDSDGESAESEFLAMDAHNTRARCWCWPACPRWDTRPITLVPATTALVLPAVKATASTLENEFVRIKVDPQSGCITSLFDKRSRTEALAPAAVRQFAPEFSTTSPSSGTHGTSMRISKSSIGTWTSR